MSDSKTIYIEEYWRKKMHDIRSALAGLPGIAELLQDQEQEQAESRSVNSEPEEEDETLSSCLFVIANDTVAILNEIRSDMEKEKNK